MNTIISNNQVKTNKVFMAFAAGVETPETTEFKRYTGIGSTKILGVNMTKKELEKIYGREFENEVEYVTEMEVNGTKVPTVRIEFIAQTDAEHCNSIDILTRPSMFISKAPRTNKDQTKVQVIDKYGRTAWVTNEQFKNKEIPVYSNGKPANIDKDYRACYVGEENLTNFIKTYLGIPNVMKYVNNEWVLVDNPQDCEARLEKIENYFKGDFSELKAILKLQPNNKIKCLYGVRTSDEGRQYQAVYTQMVLKNGVTDYSKIKKDVEDRKAAGALATTEFEFTDLHEYNVTSTDFSKNTEVDDLPFDSNSDNPFGI